MIEALAWMLIIPAISSYLAMNFTGASTYTSLSGVKKDINEVLDELKNKGLPVEDHG